MELKTVLTAAEAAAFTAAETGGKAANLSLLLAMGLPVPPYLVLSTAAWQEQLERTGKEDWQKTQLTQLQEQHVQNNLAGCAATAAGIQQEIKKHPLTGELLQQLRLVLTQTGFTPETQVAVRSSVADEDAAAASFAGQMDSFLCVQGEAAIIAAIVGCWASAYSERALLYRLHLGLPLHEIAIAVIVQEMVVGEVSGVLFTAHPVNGSRQQALITAAFGLGEGVVSGECAADEFTYSYRNRQLLHSRIVQKEQQVLAHSGSGTQLQPVPEQVRNQPALTAAQAAEVAEAGAAIAVQQGQPQDVEWTLRQGKFYFLQTRPITALPPPAESAGRRIVWDNSNIQESYCGVTTPLTFSFASRAYATVYEQTMRLMGIPEQVISGHREVLQNLLGLVKGRIYYNINNWYRGLQLLPSFKTNKADMERMMGLQDPVDFVEDKALPLGVKLRRLPLILGTLTRLLRKFYQLDSLTEQFRQHFEEEYLRIDRAHLHTLEIAELLDLADVLEERLLKRWQTPIINDFYVMMYNGRVRRWLEKAGIADAAELQNRLLSGEEGMESIVPAKEMMRLAALVRQSTGQSTGASPGEGHVAPSLQQLIEATPLAQLPRVLRLQAPEFYLQCNQFIERYGDRTMDELKLETITLRQDPAFLFGLLRSYLRSRELNPEQLHRQEQALRVAAEMEATAAIRQRLGPLALYRFRADLSRFRKGVRNRENMRFDRTRLFGLYREIYLQVGRQLAFFKLMEHERDIFYLTVAELRQYRDGRSASAYLKPLIAARKAEFGRYETEDLPHHFSTAGPVYHHNAYSYAPAVPPPAASAEGVTLLQGTGCYPGIVEEEVRLVFTPNEALALEGHILCTLRTDPGWTPLFPVCKGIIVERGSTLSHSAVVARELGIPAIVNVPGVTKLLKNGERVRMNGGTGAIEVL